MLQKDRQIWKSRKWLSKCTRLSWLSMIGGSHKALGFTIVGKLCFSGSIFQAKVIIRYPFRFSTLIATNVECYIISMFNKEEKGKRSEIRSWRDVVKWRNKCLCDVITATCIVMREVSLPNFWEDVKLKLGMHTWNVSKGFREVGEAISNEHAHF